MLATLDWISKQYQFFNDLLWDGDLPSIAFKINNSTRTWGYATYRFNTWNDTVTPVSITISNKYDSPENIKLGVLIHEMIHIADYTWHPEHFIRNGRKVSKRSYNAHGSVFFLPTMNEINAKLKSEGYDIVVYPNVQQEEIAASVLNPRAQAAADAKKNIGTTIFVYRLTSDKKLAFSYTQRSNHDKWVDYIKTSSWWDNSRMWTDEYLAHSDNFATLRSLQPGSGRYMSCTLDDFISKNNMEFIQHLQGVNNEDTTINNSQQTSITQPQEEKIPYFGFTTMQGNKIEFRNLTKSELKVKLKERFPKWSDNAIDNALNNPKNYTNKVMEINEKDIKKMVQEAVDQIINTENTPTPPGMRRSKLKQIDAYTYEESIE